MAYPVTKLISEAYYTSGIVSRQFQTVAGDQELTGIDKLNEILSDTAIEVDMIPYFNTAYNFFGIPGEQEYFIPMLDQPETLTFFIDTVRYQMNKQTQDRFFGTGRAENINSLPFNWHCERTFGGSNLFLYFFPDQNYPMQMTGRFRLQNVTVSQDLSSAITTANLGTAIVTGAGNIAASEFVVNGIDLAGTYATPTALVTYINTGVIPFVRATLLFGGQFTLNSASGIGISISTLGTSSLVNNVTFSNFNTTNGPKNQNFIPMVLDQYYINYLQYRLADRLCTAYNFIVPEGVKTQLDKYMQLISKESSPVDFSIQKVSTLTGNTGINYAQVNLGRGWTTP